MSDETPSKGPWTDIEKLGFILQLVGLVPRIPWKDLELPEGRTLKACQVMLDKEKAKVKQATAGKINGDNDGCSSAKAVNKKRKVADTSPESPVRPKTPRSAKKEIKKEVSDDGFDID